MTSVPIDLVLRICCRLRVKTLMRFKCASKLWYYLLHGSNFAKHYLQYSKTRLLLDSSTGLRDDNSYLIDLELLSELQKVPRPFPSSFTSHSRIFGSCNGLLALYSDSFYGPNFALWNPSMREYRYISNPTRRISEYDFLGFGYDVKANDYKIIMIKMREKDTPVLIYSLRANSWSQTKNCPYVTPRLDLSGGAYLDGKLHWIAENILFSFDLGVEQFDQIPIDDIFCGQSVYMNKNVGILKGNLCVTRDHWGYFSRQNCCDRFRFELWQMKEYEVKASWTKLIDSDEALTMYHLDTKGITQSICGKKVLIDDGGAHIPAWFDVEEKIAEVFDIPGAPACFTAVAYVESPVSVLPPFHL